MSDRPSHDDYKLCKTPDPKIGLWAAFTPSGHTFGTPTFQMTLHARGRSASKTVPLLASSSTRPMATVTLAGETFPLLIGWHERRRGGTLALGGERRTDMDKKGQSGSLCWQMLWTPRPEEPGVLDVQCRLESSLPRRAGEVTLSLPVALLTPLVRDLPAATGRGHVAQTLFSPYSGHALWLACPEGEASWNAEANAWKIVLRRFPLGGGRTVRFSIGLMPAVSEESARPFLVKTYARLAGNALHPLPEFPALHPARLLALLSTPSRYHAPGTERLYLQPPGSPEDGMHHAGHPFYPLDALKHMADRHRLNPDENVPRLARFGALGIAADFQVMGRDGLPQPNKGAFWDKMKNGWGKDWQEQPRHGIPSNARIARALFLLYRQGGDALLRQSALNICQWLMLKAGESGVWDGSQVHATQGTDTDGRVLPSEDEDFFWQNADAVRAFVLAYGATQNEVYIRAAWKVAHALLERLPSEADRLPASALATVVLNLLALNAEAENTQLRLAVEACGMLLLVAPSDTSRSEDGLGSAGFERAAALFALHAFKHDARFLRAGLSALLTIPATARDMSWRTIESYHAGLLSLCGLIQDARPDLNSLSVHLDWRIFVPDPATDRLVSITSDGSLWTLPLVCRASSQLLVLALAAPETERLCLTTGGRRPPVFDLMTGMRADGPVLHPLGSKNKSERPWARAAVLTVDP